MTLLLLRDAQRPARQFQLSKPVIILVPALAVLSISTLVVSLQVRSSQIISRLETSLAAQNLQLEITVSDKEKAISLLQNEVMKLNDQAIDMRERIQRVNELEQQLEEFIQKYDPDSSTKEGDKNEKISWDGSGSKGGQWIAVHNREILTVGRELKDDFEEIQELLDTVEKNVPKTLERAEGARKIWEQRKQASLLQARRLELAREGKPTFWPTSDRRLTSSFGYRRDPLNGRSAYHAGIDIAGRIGDPVYAAGAGVVIAADQMSERGKYIIIKHPNGLQSWYMHLNGMNVSQGDQVTKGDLIGQLGNTGRSTGPHLHFQVVKQNIPVDPLLYVQ
ncbi:M23 family metallopeptidase [Paenibacillus sp. P96]|uniref:M23 family metallopeptidase n=1 Tax=Paenibacillus zeirhizosphaerae TaxID=2987519 RepID=A0ABT9FW27_9BACL|nr:M23 family metallopeptidase [Paenibacillus sp. P96]MDP4098938.1 M23 family metallopeptidase [Paenibacillus sp. P96]